MSQLHRRLVSLLAAAGLSMATAVSAQGSLEFQTLAGVSAEPITEGAGLKSREDLEAFLDGVMGAHLKAQNARGAVVAVVKDGQLFFSKGYGHTDAAQKVPVDPERTLFRPGSVSKLFTWTALMQLVEQGKVDLDADVNTYITQFKIPDTWPGKPITVRNLLTHTPGLEDGGAGYLITDRTEALESLEDQVKKHPLQRVRAPATDFSQMEMSSYSNWGTSLAGLIVQNLSGEPFEDYIDKHIFAPLGMAQSSFHQPLPEKLVPQMSGGFAPKDGQMKQGPFELVNSNPAGALSATANDMARFMIAHLQNGRFGEARILKEETAKLMHARAGSPNPYLNGPALGFYENRTNGRRVITHAGDTVYFHSELNLLPEENVGIFFTTNSGATQLFSTRSDLFRLFMNRYYPAKLPELKAPDDFASRLQDYVGSYRFNRHSYSTLEKVFSFGPNITVIPSDRNTLLISYGLPVLTEWVEFKPGVFRNVENDATLAFAKGPDGNTYLLNVIGFPSMQAYRLKWYETMNTQALLIGLSLLAFVVAVVSALRHWKVDRAAQGGARLARRVAGALGGVQTLFLALLGVVVLLLTKAPLGGLPALLNWALVLPLLALPLTAGVAGYALAAWRGGWWTLYGRIQYTLIALLAVLYLMSLHYWNLIGFKL